MSFLYGLPTDRYNLALAVGGIAQLGERLHGMQEVSGSIPLTSTNQSFGFLSSAEIRSSPEVPIV